VTEAAPAKINLALHVTGRRDDGYHLLHSLVGFTEAGDRVTAMPADVDAFALSGPFAGVLSAEGGNLVTRARDLLRTRHDFPPVALHLEKSLPIASGIGGGSADAAAALRAISRLFALPDAAAADVALALGADVPMCLASRTLVANGIGEQLTPAPGVPRLPMVLVNPGVHVATPDVFAALKTRENPALPDLPDAPSLEEFCRWLAARRNDLQMPATALAPVIADALYMLSATGPFVARMSGSGATCYGIYPTMKSAQVAATLIHAQEPGWWVTATQTI
jgi:4-diphosphocytidyl-2-C-methyl-D-erythritol kinase